MQRLLVRVLPLLLLVGCTARDDDRIAGDAGYWDGGVRVHGALHAMFNEAQIGTTVPLGKILPNSDLYAVGALAGLSGEITVIGGEAYLSYPESAEHTRTEQMSRSNAGAILLVSAEVPVWQSVVIENPVRFEELDEAIGKLAGAVGLSLEERFPFILEGTFEDLRWHVVDGKRLAAGHTTQQNHLAASVQTKLDRASGTLVGFYSDRDQGVFTHMGSRTHIHCVLQKPLASGHVDHVTLPVGTTVKFPAGLKNRPRRATQ